MDIDHSSSVIFDDMEKADFSVGPGQASWLVFGKPIVLVMWQRLPWVLPSLTGRLGLPPSQESRCPPAPFLGEKEVQPILSGACGGLKGSGSHGMLCRERQKSLVEGAPAWPAFGGRVFPAKMQNPLTFLPFPCPPARCSLLPCTVNPKPALPQRNWTLRRTGWPMGHWQHFMSSLDTSSTAHISPFPR